MAAEKLEIGYRNMAEIEECFIYGDSLQVIRFVYFRHFWSLLFIPMKRVLDYWLNSPI